MKLTIFPYWERRPYDDAPHLAVSETDLSGYHTYPAIGLPSIEIEIETSCPAAYQFDSREIDMLKKEKAELYQKLLQVDEQIGKLLALPSPVEEGEKFEFPSFDVVEGGD